MFLKDTLIYGQKSSSEHQVHYLNQANAPQHKVVQSLYD